MTAIAPIETPDVGLPQLIDVRPLVPYERNTRTHSPEQIGQIKESFRRFGFVGIIAYVPPAALKIGHARRAAAMEMWTDGEDVMGPGRRAPLPQWQLPAIDVTGLDEEELRALVIADNKLALNAGWDEELLRAELAGLDAAGFDMPVMGFDARELERLMSPPDDGGKSKSGSMAEEFMIPPFSVLNAREGWWQERKRAWIGLGIASEVGRGENLIKRSLHERIAMIMPGSNGVKSYQKAKDFIDECRAAGLVEERDIWNEAVGRFGTPGNREPSGESVYLKGALTVEITTDPYRKRHEAKPGGGGSNYSAPNGKSLVGQMKEGSRAKAKARCFGQDMLEGEGVNARMDYLRQSTGDKANPGSIPGGLTMGEIANYDGADRTITGTSIFDPVLCELSYRWFCPPGGTVLDPFAGGSVRGIVAAALGRHYVGVDLRPEQVEANREQWPAIAAALGPPPPAEEVPPLRVDEIEGFRIVRDDLVLGGTKRRALDLVVGSIEADELIYATPAYGFAQIALAAACRAAGKKATIVVAGRKHRHPRTQLAAEAGAEIVEVVKGGYLTVVQKRARDLAEERGAYLVPFGMEDDLFIEAIAAVARDLPGEPPAEVWTVAGSGVLTRALQLAWPEAAFHAVQIGKAPQIGAAKLWKAPEAFEDDAAEPPPFPSCSNYDAKAWRFMREHAAPGALFWNVGADPQPIASGPEPVWHVGDSAEILPTLDVAADLIFSCPPYGDLEVYSDDPADISTLDPDAFDEAYSKIVAESVAKLRDDRFAVFVVGDYRDKRGFYRNFVSKTIAAFEAAGARLYNRAILVTSVGSLPIRAAKQFRATRKLGTTHQDVVVFVKGDPRKATAALGPVDVSAALAELEPADED